MNDKLKRKAEREFRPQFFLMVLAKEQLWKLSGSENRVHNGVASNLFLTMALEACLNFVGEKKVGFWGSIQTKTSIKEKINVLSDIFLFEVDWGKRPWQSVKGLVSLRNYFAHAYSERYQKTDEREFDIPEGTLQVEMKWEKLCSNDSVIRHKEDVEEISSLVFRKAGFEEDPFGHGGVTTTEYFR